MGFLYISLSVACSLTIAHFLKLSKNKSLRLVQVLVINYLTAFIISFTISGAELTQSVITDPVILSFSILLGGIFIANLFVYTASLQSMGMGISIAAMRISLVIPIGISLFIYGESSQVLKYLGIVLVFIALFLMIPRTKESHQLIVKNFVYTLLLFLMTGIADASLKIFEREFSANLPEYIFLGLIFTASFIIGGLYLFIKREFNFSKKEVFYGIIIGIANLYSSFFLLLALQKMDGAIVFSITNVSNVVLGSMIGFLVWKDQLTTIQKLGILIATLSIILLI